MCPYIQLAKCFGKILQIDLTKSSWYKFALKHSIDPSDLGLIVNPHFVETRFAPFSRMNPFQVPFATGDVNF
jgi:hypothetical protein